MIRKLVIYFLCTFCLSSLAQVEYSSCEEQVLPEKLNLEELAGEYTLLSCFSQTRHPLEEFTITIPSSEDAIFVNDTLHKLGETKSNITQSAMQRSGHFYAKITETFIDSTALKVTQKLSYKNCLGESLLGDKKPAILLQSLEYDSCSEKQLVTFYKKGHWHCVYQRCL